MVFGPRVLSTYGSCLSGFVLISMLLRERLAERHRRQRKMLDSVFSIKHMTPIFYNVTCNVSSSFIARQVNQPGYCQVRVGIRNHIHNAPKDIDPASLAAPHGPRVSGSRWPRILIRLAQ